MKKRSILDVAREVRAQKQTQEPLTTQPETPIMKPISPIPVLPEAKKQPGQKPPPPPFTRFEEVTCACGHTVPFGVWDPPEKKDKFREDRRKKWQSEPCKTCRATKHNATQQAAKDAKRKKHIEWLTTGRLPNGSVFHMRYDAKNVWWEGTLTIPIGDKTQVWHGKAGSVMKFHRQLDEYYRKWLHEQETKKATRKAEVDNEPTSSAVSDTSVERGMEPTQGVNTESAQQSPEVCT